MLVETMIRSLYDKDPGMEVLLYILQHTDPKTKKFNKTYDQIQKATKVSRKTISATLQKLSDAGLMLNVGRGVWENYMVAEMDAPDEGRLFTEYKG